MTKNYNNYFKDKYKFDFTIEDTDKQMNFLYSQLQYAIKKSGIDLKNKKILEIGSGKGSLAKLILEHDVSKYVGLELDQDVVKFCNKNIRDNAFINKSLSQYCQDSEEKYDVIFAFEVLEHLDDPLSEIENINSLLDKEGVFIGTSPYPYEKNIYADDTHLFVLHPVNWNRLFKIKGFKNIEVLPMSFIPVIWRYSKLLNIVIPFYIGFKYFISTTLIIGHIKVK